MKKVLLAVCALLPGVAVLADEPKGENKKLEGTWKVVSAEVAGMKATPKEFGMEEVVVKDDKLTFRNQGKEVMVFQFTTDPTKKPKAMEWIKPGDKSTLPAIYALEGDELKICTPLVPKDRKPGDTLKRPEGFDTKDQPLMLLVLKREKK
jgi:uncharacterized protein (TIGR03067 family)